jgi:biopolymer transport protein ExbB
MAVIGLASVTALAVFVERLLATQRRRVIPPRLREVALGLIREGKLDEARGVCTGGDSALANVILAALRRADRDETHIREAVEDRGRREAFELERFTGLLGTVATVSPLLGLLGTITGMIKTFQSVDATTQAGQVAASSMATGIWEALISTAGGLCVAIPAFVGYRFLVGRIDRLVAELEEASLEIVEVLGDEG